MTAVVQRLTADNAVLLAGKLQAIQSLDKLRIEVEALNKQQSNRDEDVIVGVGYNSEIDKAIDAYIENYRSSREILADKSAAAGWAPQPEGGTALWGNGTDPPAPKSSKITMVRKGKLIDHATRQQLSTSTGHPIGEPTETKQRNEEEEQLTCMLGSMLDMLRDMPVERHWDAYDKFREFFVEVNPDEKKEDEEEELIDVTDEDDDGDDQPTTSCT
ncbi:hypothetical protein AAVH_33492 [Aphelenchoides avenae]|nr:hypothetical protein AAVH_33492 [Aphelenchus avenae]